LADTHQSGIADLVGQARERLGQELEGQAEQLQKLEQAIQGLRSRHQQFEAAIREQLDALAKCEPAAPPPVTAGEEAPLEKLLVSVRNLITATLPEQVLEVLTEEAEQLGVRAAVFDVRGKAAWGSSARGFGSQLSEKTFRALVVPLSQDNPFRQVYETGGHVDASVELLKRNRNILEKFKPGSDSPILLLPVRSAGAVSAIFYADAGSKGKVLPVDALKILAEFAGAQLDRLMALSGGVPAAAVEEEAPEPVAMEASEAAVETAEREPATQAAGARAAAVALPVEVEPLPAAAREPFAAPVLEPPPPATPPVAEQSAAPPPPVAAGFDLSSLSEADQKSHKDAKRFAKLLISEIELYNKPKVSDGRKNKDLYKRLKSDIDRSRQTFEKRFGKTVGKQFDYFHDELVRTLAGNDPSLLGADYPGPSA
jgi:hypothetical protein